MRIIASGSIALAFGLLATHAFGAGYGTAGCGLGSMAFGPKPGMIQVVAATLNFTGLQTVGITFGTSNCDAKASSGGGEGEEGEPAKHGKGHKKKGKSASSATEQTNFVAANMATLKREVAQGSGDSLTAFSAVLGCETSVYPAFVRSLQAAHSRIFTSPDAHVVLADVKTVMATAPELVDGCDAVTDALAQAK